MKSISLPLNNHSSSRKFLDLCVNNIPETNSYQARTSHRIFHKKQALYSVGDTFEGIFILRSGSAKSFITTIGGEEHITKFFYPGDLLGIDGFDAHSHAQNLHFLETSSVYFLKKSDINGLVKTSDDFRDCLLQSISHAMVCDMSMMMYLSMCSSEQRLARFILDLSMQFAERGLSAKDLLLSMSRTEIANYLGMAIETVSRILSNFQQRGIVDVKHRSLTILNFETLNRCAPNGLSSHVSRIEKSPKKEAVCH